MPEGRQGLGVAVHHSYESYTAMVGACCEVDEDGAVRVHRVDCAVDCGLVLNPDIATAQMEGAVIMGLGLSLHTEVSFKHGAVVNSNFHDYPVLRIARCPARDQRRLHRPAAPLRPGSASRACPPSRPALANAIHAAGGGRSPRAADEERLTPIRSDPYLARPLTTGGPSPAPPRATWRWRRPSVRPDGHAAATSARGPVQGPRAAAGGDRAAVTGGASACASAGRSPYMR
jgi:hypothetical protein